MTLQIIQIIFTFYKKSLRYESKCKSKAKSLFTLRMYNLALIINLERSQK